MEREEAIDVIRNIYQTDKEKEALKTLIPELRESEDERIRKDIIALVKFALEDGSAVSPGSNTTKEEAIAYLEKQKEQKLILEVFGFKVGDVVRLKDGDGRKHIIKSFEKVEGLHGPNFYHVEFEDNSARDSIYPGEEYPNEYYTQMEKFEEEQKPAEPSDEELQRHQDDEDIITIHLGKILSEEQYQEVVDSVIAFMNKRWPTLSNNRFSN